MLLLFTCYEYIVEFRFCIVFCFFINNVLYNLKNVNSFMNVISGFSWWKCQDFYHSQRPSWFKVFWRNTVNPAVRTEGKTDQK